MTMKGKDRKIFYIAVLVSILLHIIGLLLFTEFDLFAFSETKKPEMEEPIELAFEQPVVPDVDYNENIPEKFYEIVENPNASGETPEITDMLSTESSLSQAPVLMPGQIRAVPGNEESKMKESDEVSNKSQQEELQEAVSKTLLAYKENRSFSRSALTGKSEDNIVKGEEKEESLGETSRRPQGFDADLVGDFALSTYEWDWAPYWLEFKRKLNRVWYAPPAYYELGLIHGHTILRFKVSREGNISDLQVLRQVGHSSLEHSSVNAIEAVFPFRPLPSSFPDEYLEVTVKMIYPNLREYRVSRND